jgi:hypothetical protein
MEPTNWPDNNSPQVAFNADTLNHHNFDTATIDSPLRALIESFQNIVWYVFQSQPLLELSGASNRGQPITSTPYTLVELAAIPARDPMGSHPARVLVDFYALIPDSVTSAVLFQSMRQSLEMFLEGGLFPSASWDALNRGWIRLAHASVQEYQGRPIKLTAIPENISVILMPQVSYDYIHSILML